MAKLYYGNMEVGMTLQEIEGIRDKAQLLMNQNYHPRYHLYLVDLFKASNAIMNEMKMDKSMSQSTSTLQDRS